MSVSTIGVVRGNFENLVFEVVDSIRKSIYNNFETENFISDGVKSSSLMNIEFSSYSKSLRCHFKDEEDSRMLYVHFDCHVDYEELFEGSKLIFSLGCWGNSEKIIRAVLKQFPFTDTYLLANDCDSNWIKL